MLPFQLTAFYKFTPLAAERVPILRQELEVWAEQHQLIGLIILATEGCNGTVAGSKETIAAFKQLLQGYAEIGPVIFKDSWAEKQPYRRFKIDVRPEIVTFDGVTTLQGEGIAKHLTPSEWQQMLASDPDVVVLDTRNTYEADIGKFKGAIVPPIAKFSQFPEFVRTSGIPKTKKVLMYCTGGIRCEKASLEMLRQGYPEVYQLGGGILKYLEEFPDADFEGECFVFDHRVSVDQKLMPSKRYKLCPHCGNPATEKISCNKCGTSAVVCQGCLSQASGHACSKNCAEYIRRHPAAVAP